MSAPPSAEELFDVVDGADRVVGRAARADVHARGLRHRATHVLVYDPRGRLYVQRRALDKECSPGLWDTSAAGHVLAGESYDACAQRELAEELGVCAGDGLQRLFKLSAAAGTGREFVMVYRIAIAGAVQPDPREIIDGGWFAPREIEAWLRSDPAAFTGTFHRIWARIGTRAGRSTP